MSSAEVAAHRLAVLARILRQTARPAEALVCDNIASLLAPAAPDSEPAGAILPRLTLVRP
jgi:hypothetical protein